MAQGYRILQIANTSLVGPVELHIQGDGIVLARPAGIALIEETNRDIVTEPFFMTTAGTTVLLREAESGIYSPRDFITN